MPKQRSLEFVVINRILNAYGMIELFGLFYGVAKGIKDYWQWDEEKKVVDFDWVDKSGLKTKYEAKGMSVSFARADRIPTLMLDGYEQVFEIDKIKRIRRSIVLRDGLTLVARSKN